MENKRILIQHYHWAINVAGKKYTYIAWSNFDCLYKLEDNTYVLYQAQYPDIFISDTWYISHASQNLFMRSIKKLSFEQANIYMGSLLAKAAEDINEVKEYQLEVLRAINNEGFTLSPSLKSII